MTSGPANPVGSPLAKPVTALWGVGAERAAQLARLDIHSIEDLLLHRPRRYEDRQHFRPIADLQLHEPAITRGKVVALGVKRYRKGTRSVFELILSDGTARLHCRWWNLPFMEKYFKVDDEVVVFGKPLNLKPRTIDHPEIEVVEAGTENFIHLNRITPVYPLTEGLPQRWVRSLIWRTLEQCGKQVGKWESEKVGGGGQVGKWESGKVSGSARLILPLSHSPTFSLSTPTRAEVLRMLHFPDTPEDAELARQRLALEEFIDLQLKIRERRQKFEAKSRALPCGGDNRLIKPFLAALRFKLSGAQTKVLREIRADLRGAHPMRRLLQGDVGSGKTLVAACSALMSIESGFSVALMAPTEILAEQHFQNFSNWFGKLGVGVELRTGSRKAGARSEVRGERSETGPRSSLVPVTSHLPPLTSHLFIGTHALLSAGVELPDLGLVIIDEQHRFGVTQREQLVRKGNYPHLLVMTATPIPRTLGLTLYGELDVSVIDEMPAGRGRIKTFIRTEDTLPKVWSFIRGKLAEGRQVYVVYPRVEESGPGELKAVTKEFENLKRLLAPFRADLLHGRMRTAGKEEVMSAFRSNATQVLVTTSLIEVGVDVPNATIMVIENAGQFGLAQLHQLRGRIGRGAHDSYCILISSGDNGSDERLKVLEETNDGFRIAEADLRLRGPGELLGQQQSGIARFRFGDLVEDGELIQLARQWVNGPCYVR